MPATATGAVDQADPARLPVCRALQPPLPPPLALRPPPPGAQRVRPPPPLPRRRPSRAPPQVTIAASDRLVDPSGEPASQPLPACWLSASTLHWHQACACQSRARLPTCCSCPPPDPAPALLPLPAGLYCGGGEVGNGVCQLGSLCCSQWGHCGTAYDFCSSDKGYCMGGPCRTYTGPEAQVRVWQWCRRQPLRVPLLGALPCTRRGCSLPCCMQPCAQSCTI